MSLGILNNISALYAQNSLNSTQNSLQNTLQQLSSGSRINSGADDAAGLAVADGLHANEAALAQSSQNATSGIGLLQTADGALSQVTNLLDRAVTLATESANGTLTGGQVSSANQEYQNILSQIGNIGSTSNFNSTAVFSSAATNIVVTDGTSGGLNTYADTIGTLTTASVGTTAGSAPVPTQIDATTIQAQAAVTKKAASYTLTPTNATDTYSGQLSFTVGSGKEVDVAVKAGATVSALQTQLMTTGSSFVTAGLSAALNKAGTALVITGPTTGATIAANTVSFTGTSLTDSVTISGASQMTGKVGTPASTGVAGTYNLSAMASNTDTFGAGSSITIGGKAVDVSGMTGDAAAKFITADTTLKAAKITAAYDDTSNVLTITGKSDGTAFTVDSTSVGTLTDTGATASTANPGTAATGSITVAKAAAATDTYSGSIILTQGSATKTINITTAKMGLATDATSVQGQITAALKDDPTFKLGTDGGTALNPVLNFAGANDTTVGGITITGDLANKTDSTAGTVTDNAGVIGAGPGSSTFTLSAMGSDSDTYGVNSTITVGGIDVKLDGLGGTDAAAAIGAAGAGVTAVFNSDKTMTISGDATTGASFTVSGMGNLTDVNAAAVPITTVSGTAASGNDAVTSGSVVFNLKNLTDTLSGSLNIEVGGVAANSLKVNIKAGSTGSDLAYQISNDASFKAAGLTSAVYDPTGGTVGGGGTLTITGPAGTTNSLTVTGMVTGSTISTPGAGSDFTTDSTKTLNADNAKNILTTVTAAIANVAYQRGTLGADINELTSASNVANAESVNLTSAEESIRATNYGQAASDLSKYQILSQTGISALAQANSVQQEVLKLLQ